MDADFAVKFNSATKQRIQNSRQRLARDVALMPLALAGLALFAVLAIVMAFVVDGPLSRNGLVMLMTALFFVGLVAAGVVMLRINKDTRNLPLPDLAIAVRGDSLWFAAERTLSGVTRRGEEIWPLSETSVAIGTQMGWFPSLVFTAPGHKPRWFYLSALDQPADEVVAQIEVRKAALPR